MNLSYQLIKLFNLSKSFEPKYAIQIFADPRSGSTWLAELLSEIPRSCIIDEPLSLTNNQSLRDLNFAWRQAIPAGEKWAEANDVFDNLYRGKNVPAVLYHKNNFLAFRKAQTGIFKIIRGKLALEWLMENFAFNYKPIFLIRHPLALIASIKQHPSWDYPFKKFELPQSPFPEKYKEHETFLARLVANWEQILAHWCIANQSYFLNKTFLKETIVVHYEDLLVSPEKTLNQIFNTWNIEQPKHLLDKIRNPSQTALTNKKVDMKTQLTKWQNDLSKSELQKASEILKYFNIEEYRGQPLF